MNAKKKRFSSIPNVLGIGDTQEEERENEQVNNLPKEEDKVITAEQEKVLPQEGDTYKPEEHTNDTEKELPLTEEHEDIKVNPQDIVIPLTVEQPREHTQDKEHILPQPYTVIHTEGEEQEHTEDNTEEDTEEHVLPSTKKPDRKRAVSKVQRGQDSEEEIQRLFMKFMLIKNGHITEKKSYSLYPKIIELIESRTKELQPLYGDLNYSKYLTLLVLIDDMFGIVDKYLKFFNEE